MTRITKREVTRLAKAIYASHTSAFAGSRKTDQAREIPLEEVEKCWRFAEDVERRDYRWEAAQVLRTLRAMGPIGGAGKDPAR